MAALFVPLSLVLVQCGRAPDASNAGGEQRRRKIQSRQAQAAADTFEDRFPQPQFADRFPTANESLPQISREVALAPQKRTVRTEPVRVAALTPTLNLPRPPSVRS